MRRAGGGKGVSRDLSCRARTLETVQNRALLTQYEPLNVTHSPYTTATMNTERILPIGTYAMRLQICLQTSSSAQRYVATCTFLFLLSCLCELILWQFLSVSTSVPYLHNPYSILQCMHPLCTENHTRNTLPTILYA